MIKYFKHLFTIITAGVSLFISIHFSLNDDTPINDIAPSISDHTQQKDQTDAFPNPIRWNFSYSDIPGLNFGTVGAVFYKGKYYLNTWNSQNVCYTLAGIGNDNEPDINTLDSILSPNYVGEIRDMAVAKDGSGNEFLWGGKAGNVLYKMDSTLKVKSQFTINGGSFRAIAWDPNRKGFWNCNFTGDITCHDTLGNVKGIISSGSTITGKYGIAWDSITTTDSSFLWIWNQPGAGSSYNTLHKINIGTGEISASYEIGLYSGFYAGGANIFEFQGDYKMLLNFQSTALVCYSLTYDSSENCNNSYHRSSLAKSIPDNGAAIYDTLNIENYRGNPGRLNVVLDTVYHSWVGDLTMILYHEGLSDTLMHRPGNAGGNSFGSSGNNFIGTKIDDTGTISMDSISALNQPYTSPPNYRGGTINGMDSLSKFMATDMNGDWILSIKDNAPGDTGLLDAWHLCIEDITTNISGYGEITEDYHLSQNYPNPFNPKTKRDYSMLKPGLVSIIVYDITGKEISVLEKGYRMPGEYSVEFNGSDLSSGIYFYRLVAEDYSLVKKMILLK